MSPVFVISDVHGCARELVTLLNKLPLEPSSTVVFLGDYIDRGPESRQVIDTILKLRTFCRVVTLRGNHEAMLQDYFADPNSRAAGLFIYNGGGATLASYADEQGQIHIPPEHRRFYDELQLSYQTEESFFVHAGVPDVPLEELQGDRYRNEMLWIRGPFHQSQFRWGKTIVHGHTPVTSVEFHERRINVDTACVYGHVLSALELPSRTVYSVMRDADQPRVHLRDYSSNRIAIRHRGALPVYVRRQGDTIELETIDYSEFGMLARHVAGRLDVVLPVGEQLLGHIGSEDSTLVSFRGTVLRHKDTPLGRCYALRIDEVDYSP